MEFKKIEKNTQGYNCSVTKRSDAPWVVRTAEKIYSGEVALAKGIITQEEFDKAQLKYEDF